MCEFTIECECYGARKRLAQRKQPCATGGRKGARNDKNGVIGSLGVTQAIGSNHALNNNVGIGFGFSRFGSTGSLSLSPNNASTVIFSWRSDFYFHSSYISRSHFEL